MGTASRGQVRLLTVARGVLVLLGILLGHEGLMAAPVHVMTHTMLPHEGAHVARPSADLTIRSATLGHQAPVATRLAPGDQGPASRPAPDCRLEALPGAMTSVPCLLTSVLLPLWLQPRSPPASVDRPVDRPPRTLEVSDPRALLQVFQN